MSVYTAWPPDDTPSSHLSRIGRNPLLYSWWRVDDEDGFTVAFVWDEATARFIAGALGSVDDRRRQWEQGPTPEEARELTGRGAKSPTGRPA